MNQSDWALALFRKSVLKQAKYDQISAVLEDPVGKHNLDLGGDNGVMSFLLRQKGGTWSSGDLDENTVNAIRSLVGERVYRLEGSVLPFPDESVDQIVVIDYLEHIHDDKAAVQEFRRVLRPGGALIINVPCPRPGSLLTRIRNAIGLTDEWHGHVRPGYTEGELRDLLAPSFELEVSRPYSGVFSESIDTALNGVFEKIRVKRKERTSSRKGTVITGQEMKSHRKAFRVMTIVHPVLQGISKLDHMIPGRSGYKLICRARLVDKPLGGSRREDRLELARDIAPIAL